MSNPYRARPGRSRVDHSAALGYGVHNQNAWSSAAPPMQSALPPTTTQQQPTPFVNQTKRINESQESWDTDAWNWSTDGTNNGTNISVANNANNGNDSWDWKIDQQSEPQQQQFVPTYANQGQINPSKIQDPNHRNNNAENASDPISQHIALSRSTPQLSREPTPNRSESFPAYGNYNQGSQYGIPSRPNSVKSSSSLDQSQWSNEQQIPNTHYTQQRSVIPEQSVQPQNYTWNKIDQNVSHQQNWQKHNEPVNNWPSMNAGKELHKNDNIGDQWMQPSMHHEAQSHSFFSHAEDIAKKGVHNWTEEKHNETKYWSSENNAVANQWQGYNNENVLQISQVSRADNNTWSQLKPIQSLSQELESNNIQTEIKQQVPEVSSEELNISNESNKNRPIYQDCQQPPATHHRQSLLPMQQSTQEPNINLTSILDNPDQNQCSAVPLTVSNSDGSYDSSYISKSGSNKSQNDEQRNWRGSTENTSVNNSHEKKPDYDSNMDKARNLGSSSDLSMGISQLNISKPVRQECNSTLDVKSPQAIVVENSYVSTNNVVSEAHQSPKTEIASNYDQWYNRNSVTGQQSEDSWFANDRPKLTRQQWTSGDQAVENYENIQQQQDFMNLEVVAPTLHDRDIYGSRDSINRETLDNEPKTSAIKESVRDYRQEIANMEVPVQQPSLHSHLLPVDQAPDNYEFASNDRNTFLETGELTDSHQEREPTTLSQDDENDEVPSDIPFLREVPGQSSTSSDPRRNDPSGQEHVVHQLRGLPERIERRDVTSGQERILPTTGTLITSTDTHERRNDPSGRERPLPSLLLQEPRNDPSGEERIQHQPTITMEPSEMREVPGRGNELDESIQAVDNLRQIPGGASPNEPQQDNDDGSSGSRVVTGSQEVSPLTPVVTMNEPLGDTRNKREEAVGASTAESQPVSLVTAHRDSYEEEDDDASGNSRDDGRERRRDQSSERRRYEYDRKGAYYEREREYDDDYYYDRRRGVENDRVYGPRDDYDRRDISYRDDDRKHHSRDDLDRHSREDLDRRSRVKDDLDERDPRRRQDDRRREPRRPERDGREGGYDPRYPRDRDYADLRDRRRDDRRSRRYDDYDMRDPYRRDYYDDPYNRSSRPSSRSSYNDRDREYFMRGRDPYYGYNGYGGYDYGPHYSSNYYAYFENLRRTNPAAYSEWYHKYYANHQQQQHLARNVGTYPEDRASVHSGRSSCDDRNIGDKRTLGDISVNEDSTIASTRMTPTKFSTAHGYGCFSIGSLVHVQPSYPADGERAKVDIHRMDNLLMHDPVARELRAYPGPLIKGVTHKKTIIDYCENKIKRAGVSEELFNRASYILLYELMIMLIQQNGNVVGVDIATLLLKNKQVYPFEISTVKQDNENKDLIPSQRSMELNGDGCDPEPSSRNVNVNVKPRKTVEEMTDEFRNTLLYGLVQEALEYAMNEGLWGHALFLASKLDKRTYASVMARFANSLPPHDPLQTLYQLHSGRIPAIVTSTRDPYCDDWRPHLAMIISNTSNNPEINRRAITTLGDTLYGKGDIHAAHFCYILAQIDFGTYGSSSVKLVLIGSNHNKSYAEFCNPEAIMLTEIYEYARNLSEPGFTLVDLQSFKFELAIKMIDYGLIEKALLYIEQIAVNITKEPSKYKQSFVNNVYVIGDKIKYHDPVCKEATEDVGALTWLETLSGIVAKYQTGEMMEEESYDSRIPDQQDQNDIKQQTQQQWNPPRSEYLEEPASMMELPSTDIQAEWQPLSLPTNIQESYDQNAQYIRNEDANKYPQPQQDYWGQQSYYQPTYNANESNWQQSNIQYPLEQTDMNNGQEQEHWNYETEREDKTPTPEPMQPTITMSSSVGKQYDPLEELDALETPNSSTKSTTESKKTHKETSVEKKPVNSGSSWFGGLFSKLTPKPRNQMILPDDSNPTIVWDPVAKKWMNKDESDGGGATTLAPPPKVTDMGMRMPVNEQPPQTSTPQPAIPQIDELGSMNTTKLVTGSNMFKLQKGRSMRANYVDVMKTNGGLKGGATVPTPMNSPLGPMAASSPQLFVPAPVNDPNAPVNFLTPTTGLPSSGITEETPAQDLSRWSSTSSLSREVQSYTMRDPRLLQRNKGPMMYNPVGMKDRSAKNVHQHSRYPPR